MRRWTLHAPERAPDYAVATGLVVALVLGVCSVVPVPEEVTGGSAGCGGVVAWLALAAVVRAWLHS